MKPRALIFRCLLAACRPAAAQAGPGGFRPAILDHPTRWNVEELSWR